MTTDETPRTQAGQALASLTVDHGVRWRDRHWSLRDLIVEAEAEAVVQATMPHCRLIRASENLFDLPVFAMRDDHGNKVTAEWGEPDGHGVYTPTFSVHYDDNPVAEKDSQLEALRLDAQIAEAAVEAEREKWREADNAVALAAEYVANDWHWDDDDPNRVVLHDTLAEDIVTLRKVVDASLALLDSHPSKECKHDRSSNFDRSICARDGWMHTLIERAEQEAKDAYALMLSYRAQSSDALLQLALAQEAKPPTARERVAERAAAVRKPEPVAMSDPGAPVDADGMIEAEFAPVSEAAPGMSREEFVRRLGTIGKELGDVPAGRVKEITGKSKPADLTPADWQALAEAEGIA